MAQHGALGLAGRSRGEDDVGGVVRGHGGPAACHLPPVRVGGPGGELGERRAPRPRRSVQHHDLLEGLEPGHVGQQRHQVGAEQVGHGEEQAGPRGAQHVAGLLAAVSGVERHQHGTDGVDGEAGDHPCGAVGGPQGHAVAALDAARHERARHVVDAFGQVPEREPGRPVDQSLVVAEAVRRLIRAPRGSSAAADHPARPGRTSAQTRRTRSVLSDHRRRPQALDRGVGQSELIAQDLVRVLSEPGDAPVATLADGRRSVPGCPAPAPVGRHRPSA